MTFLWNSPFSPLLLLTGGAFLLLGLGDRFGARLRMWFPAATAWSALFAWLILGLRSDVLERSWEWSAALGLSTVLTFQLQGWGWLAGLCLLTIVLVAVSLPGWRQRPGFSDPRGWVLLLAASAILATLSGNWMALLGAWTLLGLLAGLVAGAERGGAAFAWMAGIVSTLLLLLTPLFNGGGGLAQPLDGQQLSPQAQLLLILAAVIPLGAYPFHVWLSPSAQRSPGRQLALHMLGAVASLHLLGRFSLPLLASLAWAPLIIVALLGSALATWADRDERRAWSFALINRSTWALMALGLSQLPPPLGAVYPMVALALGSALWALSRVAYHQYRWVWPAWLAIIVLYGLPLTPGLTSYLAVGQLAAGFAGMGGWLLVMLAQILLVAYFVQRRIPAVDEQNRGPGVDLAVAPRALLPALAITLIFVVRYAVLPITLPQMTGVPEASLFDGLFGQLQSTNLIVWLTLLIPIAPGVLLAVYDERLFGALRGWQNNTALVAGLDWLYGGAGRLMHFGSVYAGYLADLVDGAGQFGWVLLAVLVAWFLLRG